jgi:hypothetical protein
VGKHDKKLLRARNAEGSLTVAVSGAATRSDDPKDQRSS